MATRIYVEFETFIVDIYAIYLLYKYNLYLNNVRTYSAMKKDGIEDDELNDFIDKQKATFYGISTILEDENNRNAYIERFNVNALALEDFRYVASFVEGNMAKIIREGLEEDFFNKYVKEVKDFFDFIGEGVYIKFIRETIKNIRPREDIRLSVFISSKDELYKKLYEIYSNHAFRFNECFHFMTYDEVINSVRENANSNPDEYMEITLASNDAELIKKCIVDLPPINLARINLLHAYTNDIKHVELTTDYRMVQNKIDSTQIYVTA